MRILLVCLGNICRSPSAEAVLRHMAAERGLTHEFDSAGTGAYHIGDPPDYRAIAEGEKRGYDLRSIKARLLRAQDFNAFDLVLGMDQTNYREMQALCPAGAVAQIGLFLEQGELADPYYSGRFPQCFDQIERGAAALLDRL